MVTGFGLRVRWYHVKPFPLAGMLTISAASSKHTESLFFALARRAKDLHKTSAQPVDAGPARSENAPPDRQRPAAAALGAAGE